MICFVFRSLTREGKVAGSIEEKLGFLLCVACYFERQTKQYRVRVTPSGILSQGEEKVTYLDSVVLYLEIVGGLGLLVLVMMLFYRLVIMFENLFLKLERFHLNLDLSGVFKWLRLKAALFMGFLVKMLRILLQKPITKASLGLLAAGTLLCAIIFGTIAVIAEVSGFGRALTLVSGAATVAIPGTIVLGVFGLYATEKRFPNRKELLLCVLAGLYFVTPLMAMLPLLAID